MKLLQQIARYAPFDLRVSAQTHRGEEVALREARVPHSLQVAVVAAAVGKADHQAPEEVYDSSYFHLNTEAVGLVVVDRSLDDLGAVKSRIGGKEDWLDWASC